MEKSNFPNFQKKTNLSVSSCQRRVKNLEESGVIESYQAVVNPKLVGMGFQALVFITLSQAAGEKNHRI
ncbi:MAG: winged helix-turn-helix transcriptional regulator [Parasutterella sp.]